MKKALAVITICILLLLVACESKTTGRRVAIPSTSDQKAAPVQAPRAVTGAVVAEDAPSTGETGKTAAEMLNDLEAEPSTATTGAKSGTFYPPITSNATGEEALKQKTDALFSQNVFNLSTDAQGQFGAKYHSNDGDPKNLPEGSKDNEGD